jgi:hypothetical protein
MLEAEVTGKRVKAPKTLVETYPKELSRIVVPDEGGEAGSQPRLPL